VGRQRAEAQHEEVQTRERDQVHGQLPQVIPDNTADTRWFKSPKVRVVSFEAAVVQSLVIAAPDLVGVLNQLVDGQGAIVGLDDGIGHH
jgi:hypothetical protein